MSKSSLAVATLMAVIVAGTHAVRAAEKTEVLFEFYCAQCHGLGGKGDGPNVTKDFPVTPRNFTNADEMNKLTDADVKNVIADGGPAASKSPIMPPWGKTLTEAEIGQLVQHLRALCKCKGKPG